MRLNKYSGSLVDLHMMLNRLSDARKVFPEGFEFEGGVKPYMDAFGEAYDVQSSGTILKSVEGRRTA